jgi:antitoxin component of MazEF toxin-antitoxin module
MRALQKLVRNGNSTQVSIPRPILIHLGWLPGHLVVVEVLEDETLRVRPQYEGEFGPKWSNRALEFGGATVKP